MSIFNTIKSRLSHGEEDEEEQFRRGIINGRFPEGVDDFEPLSTTGNFIAPVSQRTETYDDPLLAQGQAAYDDMNGRDAQPQDAQATDPGYDQGYGQGALFDRQPYEPQAYAQQQAQASGYYDPSFAGQTTVQPAAAPQPAPAPAAQGAQRQTSAVPSQADFDDAEGDVQVYERADGERRPVTQREQAKPFRERLQERVAAANVSGVIDEGLGRSKAATGEFSAAPEVVRRSPSADVPSDDLEREFESRRRANESARSERQRRSEERNREFESLQRRGAERRADSDRAQAQPSPSRDDARPRRGASAPGPASDGLEFAALPTAPLVVRARSYDDISQIAQAVMNRHQPVVLPMRGTPNDVARRVLDFSFGLCCGSGANLTELEEHVYCLMPRGTKLGEHELSTLRHQGVLKG